MLRFTELQIRYFRSVLDSRGGAVVNSLTATVESAFACGEVGEPTLANAFLRALAGDWRRAERLAEEAILDLRRYDLEIDSNLPEALYFRVVAVRHTVSPSRERWSEALSQLSEAVFSGALGAADLRYLVEYYASGLSVEYHIYVRGDFYKQVPIPSCESIYMGLRECIGRLPELDQSTEIGIRCAIQLFINLCLCFMFSSMIKPKLRIFVDRIEALRFCDMLGEVIDSAADWHRPSNFVLLVRKAVETELYFSTSVEKARVWREFMVSVPEEWFSWYDRRKYADLQEFFLG